MDDFSFDLAKLGERPSGLTIGDGKRVVEKIESEDDGPEDFTLNMEKWMRGKEVWRKKTGEDIDEGSGNDGDSPEGAIGRPENEVHGQDDEDAKRQGSLDEEEVEYEGGDESEFLPLSSSTPGPSHLRDLVNARGAQEEAEKLKNIPAPPLSRLNTEAKHDRAAEEVFVQISALQEEVERLRFDDENRRYASEAHDEEHKKLLKNYEDLKVQLQKERKIAADWQANQAKVNDELAGLQEASRRNVESEIGFLRGKLEPLAKELDTVKSEAEASKQAADAEIAELKAELEASQIENIRRSDAAENVQAATSLMIKQSRSELETSKREVAFEQKLCTAMKEEHKAAMERIRIENQAVLNATKADAAIQRIELEHAQEQLIETRRVVTIVEDQNDRLAQKNERQAADISDLRTKADCKNTDLQAAISTIEKLNAELRRLHSSNEDDPPKTSDPTALEPFESHHHGSLAQLNSQHQTALSELQQSHSTELATLRSTLLKAAEGMRKREARFTNLHHEEIASLKQELKPLTQRPHPAPASKNDDAKKLDDLRTAVRLLSQQLSTTKTELASTQTSLHQTQAALDSTASARDEANQSSQKLESMLEMTNAVNKDLEVHFAQVVEAREKEWRRRVNLLFKELNRVGKELEQVNKEKGRATKEREKMGRALMVAWGREEVGGFEEIGAQGREGDGCWERKGQGYRYLYAEPAKGVVEV